MPKVLARARRREAHLVFLDESGFMLTPTVRRTFAPRGRTPILRSWDRHDRISAISAITVSPSRRRLGLVFRLLPDDVNARGEHTVEFLRELRRQLPVPMTILWDKGNIHDRSKAVRAYLADHPSIETVPFPSYTPEANPDEGVWQHTKHGRLANFTPGDTTELRARVGRGAGAVASPAEAPGVVHPPRTDPNPATDVVLLERPESIRRWTVAPTGGHRGP